MISFLLLSCLLLQWYRESERMWTSRLCTLRSVPYCLSKTETHHENPQDLRMLSSTYVYSYTLTWYLKSSRVFVTLASSMHLMQCSLSAYERGSWRQWELYGIVRCHRRPLEDSQDPQGESRSGEISRTYYAMVLQDYHTHLPSVLVQLMPLSRKAKATGGSEVSPSTNGWVDFRKSTQYCR